jgi:simple sugar transport system permease protein
MSEQTRRPSLGSMLRRPETGSFFGLAAVFVFFAVFGGADFVSAAGAASWLNVAASLGIVALPIGLLMIAGELDISIGSMIPAGSMTVAILSGHFHLPILVGISAALAFGAIVGFVNGVLVVRTAVPSFIVTLGTLFAVAGSSRRPWRQPNRCPPPAAGSSSAVPPPTPRS